MLHPLFAKRSPRHTRAEPKPSCSTRSVNISSELMPSRFAYIEDFCPSLPLTPGPRIEVLDRTCLRIYLHQHTIIISRSRQNDFRPIHRDLFFPTIPHIQVALPNMFISARWQHMNVRLLLYVHQSNRVQHCIRDASFGGEIAEIIRVAESYI